MGRYYRVGEVATLTRVSVRTLHHYDRIGLLRPALHSAGGYRLYEESDLLRLQQILTLRYLGFPLKQIGELLDRADSIWSPRSACSDRCCMTGSRSWSASPLPSASWSTSAWRPGSGPGNWLSRRRRRLPPV